MRENDSSFRYFDYYKALGTMRGALGKFDKAVTLMRPPSIYSHDSVSGLLVE